MKYKITLYLIILLLSSCSILDKTGIEKRRYRPGYYISMLSPTNIVRREVKKPKADIELKLSGPSGNAIAALNQSADSSENIAQKLKATSCRDEEKTPVADKIKSIATAVYHARPSQHLFQKRSAACTVQKQASIKDWGDGCANLVMEIAILLIALVVYALFPGIDPQAAELIATGILLIAIVIAALLLSIH